MKRYQRAALFLIPAFIILLAFSCGPVLNYLISAYIGGNINADVRIKKTALSFENGIIAENAEIKNKNGLRCRIKKVIIKYSIASAIREGQNFRFQLHGVEFSYPDSGIINSISKTLSIAPVELLSFDYIEGRLLRRKNEIIIQGLSARGQLMQLSADATLINNKRIDCSLKLLLSKKLISGVPESTRKVFFRQAGPWSAVELYLKGDLRQPSINLSTDLFKLIVR